MGAITSTYFMSIDGVIGSPETFTMDYANDELGAVITPLAASYEAFVMGRKQYDEWSQHWTGEGADDPFAPYINSVAKYVVSDSLTEATWNNTTIVRRADAADGLKALRDRTEGVIGTWGSITVVRWMLANGLVDRLHLIVCPVVVGQGARLFEDLPTVRLEPVSHETLGNGVQNLVYVPIG